MGRRRNLHSPRSSLERALGAKRPHQAQRLPRYLPGPVSRQQRPLRSRSEAPTRPASRSAIGPSRRKVRTPSTNVSRMEQNQPTSRRRFVLLNLIWVSFFALIFVPMIRLQVTDPTRFVDLAKKQRIRSTSFRAERGDLVDRSGVPLAISVREWRVVADPKIVNKTKSAYSTSSKLAQFFQLDRESLATRLGETKRYVPLIAGINEAAMRSVQFMNLPGISLEETPRRIYPAGDVARSVLGRVGRTDHDGVSGLEKMFDAPLTGTAGTVLAESSRWGKQIPAGERSVVPPKRGTTFVLTLDRSLNYALDGMLAQAIANSQAKGGTLVVADIRTGDVLSLSCMRVSSGGEVRSSEDNQALVSVFEPGSTNKVITIAAALEEGVVGPYSELRVPDHLVVADHRFKDDDPHETETWTPGQILAESSNIGTIKIAQALRSRELDKYLRGFGLGQKTAIDFPGEARGLLMPVNKWTGTSIGTLPIGQGLAVTSMQMLSVYATIANGGVRTPLRFVRGTIDSNGKEKDAPLGQSLRVVSDKTAKLVTEMLEKVVADGTGIKAQIKGYTVAGKTGTAQKPNLHSRGYQKDAYVASFAGFFPSERPRLALIAVLDEPRTSIYGGAVAAPLFAEAAIFAGQHYRIPPSTGSDVRIATRSTADVTVHNAEMRAVAKAGTWQEATIRQAALRGPGAPAIAPQRTTKAPAPAAPQASTSDLPGVASNLSTNSSHLPLAEENSITRRQITQKGSAATIATTATVAPPTIVTTTMATTTTHATIPDMSPRAHASTAPPRAVVAAIRVTTSSLVAVQRVRDGVAASPVREPKAGKAAP